MPGMPHMHLIANLQMCRDVNELGLLMVWGGLEILCWAKMVLFTGMRR